MSRSGDLAAMDEYGKKESFRKYLEQNGIFNMITRGIKSLKVKRW